MFKAIRSGNEDSEYPVGALVADDPEIFLDLVSKISRNLDTLIFNLQDIPDHCTSTRNGVLPFTSLPSLRVFSTGGRFNINIASRIIAACGETLEEIWLYNDYKMRARIIDSITTHCRRLHTLSSAADTIERGVDLESMFEQVGRTLRRLRFRPPVHEDDPKSGSYWLVPLTKNCRRLRDVEVWNSAGMTFLLHLGPT